MGCRPGTKLASFISKLVRKNLPPGGSKNAETRMTPGAPRSEKISFLKSRDQFFPFVISRAGQLRGKKSGYLSGPHSEKNHIGDFKTLTPPFDKGQIWFRVFGNGSQSIEGPDVILFAMRTGTVPVFSTFELTSSRYAKREELVPGFYKRYFFGPRLLGSEPPNE